MLTTIHTLLLLLGLERTIRSHDSQPRLWGGILIITASLGSALVHYQLSSTQWATGAILYVLFFLAGLALSPLQLVLVLWSKPRNEVSTGMVVIYEPEKAEDISVDIVAVHGLGSDPEWAWTYWETRNGVEVSNNIMWLRDLLPQGLPRARIMTFNHDSAWQSNAPVKSVQDCGNQLLNAVRTCRNNDQENKRRIIFIGHSFGGIIIKKALVTAGQKCSDARYQSLCESVLGALFLGVPHDGSPLTKAGILISYITYWLGSRTELLEALLPGTDELWALNHSFLNGYGTSKHHVVNFFETRKTQKWGVPLILAVNQKASSMAGKANVPLECDHMRMNKFKSNTDANYQLVLRELREMVEGVQKAEMGVITAEKRDCLSTIFFEEMDARLNTVSEADASTFEWVWTDTQMTKWRAAAPGILWVVGKPGSGKSTLCKYLFEGLSKETESVPSTVLAGFFFNARGTSLAQCLRGLLQALVYQTLQGAPSMFTHILPKYREMQGTLRGGGEWPLKALLDAFLLMIEDPGVKSLYLFIDALDECVAFDSTKEPTQEDALTKEYLSRIFDVARCNPRVKLLVTSRHQRFPGILDGDYVQLTLENMTKDDIQTFLERRILQVPTEHRCFVQAELMARASGVFLWVKLVLEDLIEECAESSDEELKQILMMVPNELDSLYARMLQKLLAKLRAPQYVETRLMFEWVSLAERPLSVSEFRYAIALSQNTFTSIQSLETSGKVQKLAQTKERLKRRSGGLLEVNSDTVQFIHHSVKEFCMGSARLPQQLRFDVVDAHVRIAAVCTGYLGWPEFQSVSPGLEDCEDSIIGARGSSVTPFLSYALCWITHAQLADASGNPLLKDVWRFASSKSPLSPPHPLPIAAQFNMPRFVTYLLDHGMHVDSGSNLLSGNALQRAASNGHRRMAELLIGRGADVNLGDLSNKTALHAAASNGRTELVRILLDSGANIHQSGSYGSPLHCAALWDSVPVVELLLDRGADLNSHGHMGMSVLQLAAYGGASSEMVHLLLDRGAAVNAVGEGFYGPALQAAVSSPRRRGGPVRTLLERGANVNATGGYYGTTLQAAAHKGRLGLVQLLLDNCVDVNATGGTYGTALQAAACGGGGESLSLVQLLLDNCADVSAAGGKYGNALQAAASKGQEKLVQLLLENGADVNAAGGKYESALQAAAKKGNENVIKLLLGRGAEVNTRGGKFETVLMAAVQAGGDNSLKLLLDGGADVNMRGGLYDTALQTAAQRGDGEDAVKLLLSSGSAVNAQGGLYGNALQAAALKGHQEIVRLLLAAGADATLGVSIEGLGEPVGSPLEAAEVGGHSEVVRMIQEALRT